MPAIRRKDIPAEQRRRILRQLNEHGEQNAQQLSAALKMERSTLVNYLRPMKADQEIAVREATEKGRFAVFYRALLPLTRADAEAQARIAEHPLLSQFRILGRETHTAGARNRSTGGQGALPPARGIASCADWI